MTTRVIDSYDDNFASLNEFFASSEVPEFIKQASMLSTEQMDTLPDHVFALIARDGQNTLRKFACVDKAHTAMNVLYLSRYADTLPKVAAQKAASNLCLACERYGYTVPEHLRKMAEELPGKPLIKTDANTHFVNTSEGGAYPRERGASPTKESDKATETNGVLTTKQASWDPYLDLTNRWPVDYRPADFESSVMMRGREYPLDAYDQVKTASDRFSQEWRTMHPRDRREAAVGIEKRASALDIVVGPVLEKYACSTMREESELVGLLTERANVWPAEVIPIVTELLEKRASSEIDPDVFANAIAEIDIATETDRHWGRTLPDPWETVFGKVASEKKSWDLSGTTVHEDDVRSIATQHHDKVAAAFGDELARGLKEDPVTVFDSLPMDTQRVIASIG